MIIFVPDIVVMSSDAPTTKNYHVDRTKIFSVVLLSDKKHVCLEHACFFFVFLDFELRMDATKQQGRDMDAVLQQIDLKLHCKMVFRRSKRFEVSWRLYISAPQNLKEFKFTEIFKFLYIFRIRHYFNLSV
jgi:hypothetical protein